MFKLRKLLAMQLFKRRLQMHCTKQNKEDVVLKQRISEERNYNSMSSPAIANLFKRS